MTRDEVVAEARRYLGVPWRRHGRSEHGIDCGGLPLVVGRAFGEKLEDIAVAARAVPPGETLRMLAVNLVQRPTVARLAIGAVAVFAERNDARHVGIIARLKSGAWTLINAHAGTRRVVEESLTPWLPKLVATFDFKTVDP